MNVNLNYTLNLLQDFQTARLSFLRLYDSIHVKIRILEKDTH